jgi:hypothetical protein
VRRGNEKSETVWSRSLELQRYGSLYLSATNGNRVREAVIKVEHKPTSGLKHIGRNSMPVMARRQEGIFHLHGVIGETLPK